MARAILGRGRWWLLAAVGLSLLLRLPFLGLPMISDEGGYAYVARRWLDGRGELYDDLWVSRPQGIFVAYGAIARTLGDSAAALRLGAWLASALTLVFVWRYARDWAGAGTAALAAVIFAVVGAAPSLEGFTANAEVFMGLPAAVAAWWLLRLGTGPRRSPGRRPGVETPGSTDEGAQRAPAGLSPGRVVHGSTGGRDRRGPGETGDGWGRGRLLAIGALAGLATLLKPSGVVVLPVAVAFAWLEGAAGARVAARRSGWLVAGFAAGLAPALVHGWLIGWDDFVYAAVLYRVAEQNSLTNGPVHHLLRLGSLFLDSWWLLAATLVPLWGRRRAVHARLVGGLPRGVRGLVRAAADPASLRRRVEGGGRDPGGTLLRLWLLGCGAGIAMGGDWWAHYLIQIAGPLAIGLAVLVRDAAPSVTVARSRRLAVGGAVALLLLVPYRFVALGEADRMSAALFHNTGYPVHDEVAVSLEEHTAPETLIFVAFNDAAVYYLADRPSPYRYLFNQELLAFPDSQAWLVVMVSSSRRPEVVVRTGMPAPYADGGEAFWAAVAAHYRVEAVVGGATIYRALEPAATPPAPPPTRPVPLRGWTP